MKLKLNRRRFLKATSGLLIPAWMRSAKGQVAGPQDLPFFYTAGVVDPNASLKSGLVSYWTMNDPANGTRVDSVGSSNLTDHTSDTLAPTGKIGNAAMFQNNGNVATHGLTTSGTPFIAGAGASFTIAGWLFNQGWQGNSPAFSKWGTAPNAYLVWFDNTNVIWQVSENLTLTSRSLIIASISSFGSVAYRHLAVGYDTALQKIWFQLDNGSRTLGNCADVNADLNAFVFGNYSTFSLGNLVTPDEFGFWNRSLTTTEVGLLYNGGNGLTYANF